MTDTRLVDRQKDFWRDMAHEKRRELELVTRQRDEAKAEAERLFQILDDIDTASDAFKPDLNPYVSYVDKKNRTRFDGPISTDGYDLIWSGAMEESQ